MSFRPVYIAVVIGFGLGLAGYLVNRPAEYVPLYFSKAAPLIPLVGLAAVGLVGVVLRLDSRFF